MVLRIAFLLFLISLIYSCSSNSREEKGAETEDLNSKNVGKEIYSNYCISCHGTDGKLGVSGATDLSESSLSDAMRQEIITNGKNAMPPMKDLIQSKEDILAVSEYIKSLKK
jgi:cytochrome c6